MTEKQEFKPFLPLNLQYFADEPGGEGKPDGGTPGEPKPEDAPKSFTQSDLDRAVQQGIATFQKNHAEKIEQEARQKIEAELAEAEKMKKLTAEERVKLEAEKEKAKFDQEKAQFQKEKLTFETAKELVKRGLDESFAEFLVSDTAESTLERVNQFTEHFNAKLKEATEKQVTERLGNGYVPKSSTGASGVTLDAFLKMSFTQQNEIYENNRPLYDALMAEYKKI